MKKVKLLKTFKLIGFLAALAGVVILAIAILTTDEVTESFAAVVYAISLPPIVIGAVCYFLCRSSLKSYCLKCEKSMHGCEYSYHLISEHSLGSTSDLTEYKFDIVAICPHCGAEKQFKASVTCRPNENLDYKIANYCRNKFGH